ncbi:MAG: methyltransferase domain-containing protein [Geobacteraceae bacterium]|nr:methyltransferase domain-containing protein [Geobacteraceae bacterium]
MISRAKVRRSFDRQAVFYEETVVVQKLIRENLLFQLQGKDPGSAPRRILDVGAGTGILLREIRKLYPGAFLAGLDLAPAMSKKAREALEGEGGALLVEGDAESLPFADATFDLVVSTSTFQWLNTLEKAFCEAFRVLSPGGTFHFALFGGKTLYELLTSYKRALKNPVCKGVDRTHRFFSLPDVKSALKRAGFSVCSVEKGVEVEYHPNVKAMLRSLQRIGAGNASRLTPGGLGGRRVMLEMMEIYRAVHGCSQGIPATYEIVYGKGRKR